jgi:hypothetical protein
MVVLLVLFAAMFLLVNGGGSSAIAVVLVLSTLAPLVAGVVMSLRLPEDARVCEAGDAIAGDLMGSVKGRLGNKQKKKNDKKASKAPPAAVCNAAAFATDNPMREEGGGQGAGEGAAAGRESDLDVKAAKERAVL